jgi:hypothetical protein
LFTDPVSQGRVVDSKAGAGGQAQDSELSLVHVVVHLMGRLTQLVEGENL